MRIRRLAAAIAVASALSAPAVPALAERGDLVPETPTGPPLILPRDEPCDEDGGWSGNWLRCPGPT
ncbi:hypothetical protein [Nocardiopsis aegyptia]|uniref:Uncharacterized protein n=1 Tax=Nocardiopsis aegyptia TaxID=220378 RepID=A0A7Z0EQL1_9ACTN|nr:hypothetical protein [Nocardiopsis aegyptia]NYJ35608.1 hypothetical protein [Nocardiopsis aegyptia]